MIELSEKQMSGLMQLVVKQQRDREDKVSTPSKAQEQVKELDGWALGVLYENLPMEALEKLDSAYFSIGNDEAERRWQQVTNVLGRRNVAKYRIRP